MSFAQRHVKSRVTHAGPDIAWLASIAVVGVLVEACAGRQHVDNQNQNQPPPHSIEVQVDNDRSSPDEQPSRRPDATGQASGPLELRVFVTQDQGGTRQYLGTVPGGQTQTLKFVPTQYGNWYRLIGVTPLGTTVQSTRFSIDNPEIGAIEWTLQTGMINYYNVAVDSTGAQPGTSSGGSPPSTQAKPPF